MTLATLPPAAWAITLARMTGRSDVLFGEVVSGRTYPGLNGAENVVGPTWQYVPVRLKMTDNMTAGELLDLIQHQHVESAPHGCVSLREMVREGVVGRWVPPWEQENDNNHKDGVTEEEEPWFPTVVHQAVVSAGKLSFGDKLGTQAETIYPHQEPLREVKLQAFVEDGGSKVTLEVVTFQGWKGFANELLERVSGVFEDLLSRPNEVIW